MTVDEMLDKMDMHAVLMMQGLLANRGLKLLYEAKAEKTPQLLVPDTTIITPDVK